MSYVFNYKPTLDLSNEQLKQISRQSTTIEEQTAYAKQQAEIAQQQLNLAIAAEERAKAADDRAAKAEAQLEANRREKDRTETKLSMVRTLISRIEYDFTEDFSNSIQDAYKMTNGTTPFEQLRELANRVIRSRENMRVQLRLVEQNTKIIYESTNSLIDELSDQLSLPNPNWTRVRDLLNRIYERHRTIISRTNTSVEIILNTLGCRKDDFAIVLNR
jgi:hypothetical protein